MQNKVIDDFSGKEFPMTNSDFKALSDIAYRTTGIVLGEHKKSLVYSRVVRRIRTLGLRDFNHYCEFLSSDGADELHHFINAITTNLTSFFREKHHFDFLENHVFPELLRKNTDKKIRIWSAGCSTGEEPYSIAMVAHKFFRRSSGWDIKILATDLDSNVVNHGRQGEYDLSRVEGLSKEVKKTNFQLDRFSDKVRVKEDIRSYITFNRLNLLSEWPIKKKFDVIFCRNVVIYFNKETQKVLFDRYADILKPDGYLFIGHSENLNGVTTRFESLGKTQYRKTF